MKSYFQVLRSEQWIKNIFLFAGLIFSRRFVVPGDVFKVVVAFLLFCIASGSVYIINDVFDREQDRIHPYKRYRPISSGEISVKAAVLYSLVLQVVSLVPGYFLDKSFFFMVLLYWVVMFLYSVGIKKIVILDILCVAFGFVIRVVAGALVIHVEISSWLLLCTLFFALFLVVAKRRGELINAGEASREALRHYSPSLLDMLMAIVTTSVIVGYSLYTLDPRTVEKFGTRGLAFTIPFVIYGVFRYLYLVYQKGLGESPEKIIWQDKPMLANLILWGVVVLLIITGGVW